jgi:hypothetical protein
MSAVDHIADAQVKINALFPSTVFYRAALESGFGPTSEDVARKLWYDYQRGGWDVLPDWTKSTILALCVEKER